MYLSELDELSRLIQLEAAALSYGVVVVLASIWFSAAALGLVAQTRVSTRDQAWCSGCSPRS